MRLLFAASVLACQVLLVTVAGAADDIVGRWVLDEEAFRRQAEGFYAEPLSQVPADRKVEAERFVAMAVEAAVEQMLGSSVTFAADGVVVLEPAAGGAQRGTWTWDGGVLRLEPAIDAPEAVKLTGELRDDGTLLLRPDHAGGVGFAMRRAPD